MKEFIEKSVGRLEELYSGNDKEKKEAYEEQNWENFDLFTHRNEGIYIAISIINQLAEEYINTSTDTASGWIPCSERLPEDCSDVICTTHLKGNAVMNVVVLWYNAKLRKWMNCDDEVVDDNLEVIAWQPLPQPYQEEGGKNE